MYNPKSSEAEEFISNEEILSTLEYASKNKNNIFSFLKIEKLKSKIELIIE